MQDITATSSDIHIFYGLGNIQFFMIILGLVEMNGKSHNFWKNLLQTSQLTTSTYFQLETVFKL